jgi:quinol monooxygenase YgiN
MIVLAHRARIKHGALLETLQLGHVMEDSVRRASGCITYKIYLDPSDPNTFFIFEEWASQENFDASRKLSIALAFHDHLGRQLAAPLHSQRYEVDTVTPI